MVEQFEHYSVTYPGKDIIMWYTTTTAPKDIYLDEISYTYLFEV